MKKNIETSKSILYFTEFLVVVIVIASIVVSLVTHDSSPMEWVSAGVFALATTAHGFYFWKAKAENLHKYGLDDKISNDDMM